MKKSMLALAITALVSTAWAQVSPAPVGGVSPATPLQASQTLPPLPTGANPFTGVTKAQTEIQRSEDELKRLRSLSTQKLALQRDELDALRIELDKKKILDALNPPKPVEVKPAASSPVSSSGGSRKPVVAKAAPVEKPAPTPPQIIAPSAAKYEAPQVLGVIDIAGQRVAMMKFDGQTVRATSGSTVGGKPISAIEPSGVQWGSSFLTVAASSSAPPSFVMTDDRSDPKNRAVAAPVTSVPQAAPVQTYVGPAGPVILSPQGAVRTTGGASGPTGVLQLPPPPPSLGR